MNRAAASPEKSATNSIPELAPFWILETSPELADLNSFVVAFQFTAPTNTSLARIFGRVNAGPSEVTAYALDDGRVTAQDAGTFVSFSIIIEGVTYLFDEGRLNADGTKIEGGRIITSSRKRGDEGSWSAQAQTTQP